MPSPNLLTLVGIGALAGFVSGMFGVGGGVIIVPLLVFLLGYTQHTATGTSLAILLPPIGLLGVLEYYRNGNIDLRAGLVIAVTMMISTGVGAFVANKLGPQQLKLLFGIFMIVMGSYMAYTAAGKIAASSKPLVKETSVEKR